MSVREKGNAFEREVAKKFTDRFGVNFRRTPLSGGWDKEKLQGDITSGDKTFKLVVECKNHKTIKVPEWWKQVEGDTPENKIPLLVMKFSGRYLHSKSCPIKKNLHETFALLRVSDLYRLITKKSDLHNAHRQNPTYFANRISYASVWYDMIIEKRRLSFIETDSYTGVVEKFILIPIDLLLLHVEEEKCYNRRRVIRKKPSRRRSR